MLLINPVLPSVMSVRNTYETNILSNDEDYLYICLPIGMRVPGIVEEWYTFDRAQLEFFKVKDPDTHATLDGWYVEPVWYGVGPTNDGERRFPFFIMSNLDVLKLWVRIVEAGEFVSDGIINLF